MNATTNQKMGRRLLIMAGTICLASAVFVPTSRADIKNWQTGETIPGTEGITPGPGIDLSFWNTDRRNLRFADFSGGLDLSGSQFSQNWLDNAHLRGQPHKRRPGAAH